MGTQPDLMTAAEMRVVREHLGLTRLWLAQHLAVAERTVARWEDDVSPIPDGVRVEIERVEQATADAVTIIIEAYEDMRDPTEVPLLTYRTDEDYRAHHPEVAWPASWHRAVCGRVADEVPGLTIDYWAGEG